MSAKHAARSGKQHEPQAQAPPIQGIVSFIGASLRASEVDVDLPRRILEERRRDSGEKRPLGPEETLQVLAELHSDIIWGDIRNVINGRRSTLTTQAAAKTASYLLAHRYHTKIAPQEVAKAWEAMFVPLPSLKEVLRERGDDPAKLNWLVDHYASRLGEPKGTVKMKVRYYTTNFSFRLGELDDRLMQPQLFVTIIPRLEHFYSMAVTAAYDGTAPPVADTAAGQVREHAAQLLKGDNKTFLYLAHRLLGLKLPNKNNFSGTAATEARLLLRKYGDRGE
jgi:hypothetical protein